MKIWYSLLLSFLVLGMGSRALLLQIDYSLNRPWYEVKCENISRPKMDCHGKCQLRKKAEPSSRLSELVNTAFICTPAIDGIAYDIFPFISVCPDDSYLASSPQDCIFSYIHPPDFRV